MDLSWWDPKTLGKIVIDVADSLLFGLPSTTILEGVRHDYDMDYADAMKMIEKIQQAIREQDVTIEQLQNDRDRMLTQLYDYSPLGEFRKELESRYSNKGKDLVSANAKMRDLNRQLDEQTQKATEAQLNKSKTLGTEALERVFNA